MPSPGSPAWPFWRTLGERGHTGLAAVAAACAVDRGSTAALWPWIPLGFAMVPALLIEMRLSSAERWRAGRAGLAATLGLALLLVAVPGDAARVLARTAAWVFVLNALPFTDGVGWVALRESLRRSRPQLAAALLCHRAGANALPILAAAALPWVAIERGWLHAAVLAAIPLRSWLAGRRRLESALALEILLQQGWREPGLRPLPAAAFEPWRARCERAYERRAGTRASTTNAAASSASSRPTDAR